MPSENQKRLIELLEARAVDLVTFTSSSTVNNLVEMVGKPRLPTLLAGITIACIGEITAEDARKQGLEVHVIPKEHTISGLVRAIVSFYRRRTK
jgi:uroporphyrinogen-III synthase